MLLKDLCTDQPVNKWAIKDGKHVGYIRDIFFDNEKDRLYIDIQISDSVIFKTSISRTRFLDDFYDIFAEVLEADADLSDLIDCKIRFRTSSTVSKDGKRFSNIMALKFVLTDETNDSE